MRWRPEVYISACRPVYYENQEQSGVSANQVPEAGCGAKPHTYMVSSSGDMQLGCESLLSGKTVVLAYLIQSLG